VGKWHHLCLALNLICGDDPNFILTGLIQEQGM
jgi:hypothetical protein